MAARVRDIENPGCIEKDTKFYFLKEELLRIYCNAVVEKCYFCNSNYKNENSMEVAAFKSLFNFQNIPAMRELDDNESDSSKGISKRVIALLKDNDTWVEATKKLPDLLMADIEDSGAKKEIKNSSIKSLDDTIRDISKTSGGHIGKLQLEMDVKEQDVEEFIRRITRAKYDVDGLLAKCRTLNEKILHKEIFIYDEEFKIYKEIMPGFRKASKSVLDYLVIIKLLVEKRIEDTTEGKEKIQKAYASAYEMTFAYYDLVMDEGIFIEEQTYVMLMNFFAHCEKILRINLNPENWKDMKWDEIIDNQINEENKITCHLRNKIRSC